MIHNDLRIPLNLAGKQGVPASSKLIYGYLRLLSGNGRRTVTRRAEEIAGALGLGVRTVFRALGQLRRMRLLTWARSPTLPNEYTVTIKR